MTRKEILNGNSAFSKVLNKYYKGIISDMKAGVFSPPITGKYAFKKNHVNKTQAYKWAINTVITMNPKTVEKIAEGIL